MTPEGDDMAVFDDVYTPEIIERISTRARSDNGLSLLYQMLTGANRHLAVDRAHLAKLLHFAKEKDGLDTDRLSRLRQPENYAAWRAVHNELLVPYFFRKAFGLTVAFTVDPTCKGQGDFQIVPRLMMPIVLCIDHRVLDGADAIKFLRVIMDTLEDPDELLISMV